MYVQHVMCMIQLQVASGPEPGRPPLPDEKKEKTVTLQLVKSAERKLQRANSSNIG